MKYLICLMAFIFASIPWGYLIGKARGVDLRKTGSGNIGATNVLRTVGKKEALLTLMLDISKGFAPVFIVKLMPSYENDLFFIGIVGICSILGHCYTPFLKFKGGKGVATSVGAILAYTPVVGLVTIFIWIVTFKIFHISSLGALLSFGLLPITVYLLGYSYEVVLFCIIVTSIIYLRHIPNIKRLLKGTEPKMGGKQ